MMPLNYLPFFNKHESFSVFGPFGYFKTTPDIHVSFGMSARAMEICGGHVRSGRQIAFCGPQQDNIRYDRAVVIVNHEGTYIYRRVEEGQGVRCLFSLTAVSSSMYPVELHANFNISVRGTLITPFGNFQSPIDMCPPPLPFPRVQAILMSMRDVAVMYRGPEGVARLSQPHHPSANFKNYEVVVDLSGVLLHRRTDVSREMFYFNNSAMPLNIDPSGVARIKVPRVNVSGPHTGAIPGVTMITAAHLSLSNVNGWRMQQLPPSEVFRMA
jgi:hypothetical protein